MDSTKGERMSEIEAIGFDKYKTCKHLELSLVEKHKGWGFYRCELCYALFKLKDNEVSVNV